MTDEERSLEQELTDAEARAVAYRAALARVRPWLEGTDRTLGEALAAMRAAGIDPAWPITPPDDVPV